MMPRGGRARIRKLDPPLPLPARTPARARVGGPRTRHETPMTRNAQSLGPALDEVAPSHEVALRASQPPPAAASAPSLAPASLFPVARSPEALWSGGGPTASAVADSHRLDTTEKAAEHPETAWLRFSDERRADRREPIGFALKVLRT